MESIRFDKMPLSNLALSMKKEVLEVGENGSYFSTNILGCHTRKYHGLFVVPQTRISDEMYVLLSQLDETIIQRDREFNIGVRKYRGDVFSPKGHKYLTDLDFLPYPKWTYSVGGLRFSKEILMDRQTNTLYVKYHLLQAKSDTFLRVRPFMAFRNRHHLCKKNSAASLSAQELSQGIAYRMYPEFDPLFIQASANVRYSASADWYYDVEYLNELDRGYDAYEDLFTPGFFEFSLQKGESIYLRISLQAAENPDNIAGEFEKAAKKITLPQNLEESLQRAAQQFIVRKNGKTEIVAGYPWFGRWGRDTFISLPGLTLARNDAKTCKEVLDTMLSELKGVLFPNIGSGDHSAYNSVDAPMWFFWAVQQYTYHTKSYKKVWDEYGESMKNILEGFRSASMSGMRMLPNGLIYAAEQGKALTWMDAIVDGLAVTQRAGMAVEINALWYNAIMFVLELAKRAKDQNCIDRWKPIAETLPKTFKQYFWNKEHAYLADVVSETDKDWSNRPNQIIAVSLPYSMLSDKIQQIVVENVKQALLCPRGLRTISPMDSRYTGIYQGDQARRDRSYHQGVVWVWLLGHFAEAYLKVYKEEGLAFVKTIYNGFTPAMSELCIGSIAEIYDADPPYRAKGSVAQAWSVSELLRMHAMIRSIEKK